jgi:hypothetical protein
MREHPQIAIETRHYHADGLYAREITIPAGCLLTGKVHKREHINIVAKGCISIVTDEGEKLVEAPCVMVSKPGTKRVGYAHEETVWVTVHATTETDVEKLELELVTDDYAGYLMYLGEKLS